MRRPATRLMSCVYALTSRRARALLVTVEMSRVAAGHREEYQDHGGIKNLFHLSPLVR